MFRVLQDVKLRWLCNLFHNAQHILFVRGKQMWAYLSSLPLPMSTPRRVYGYGNSGGEIPEGYIDVMLPGNRQQKILHPAYPGSVYHTTK